MKRMFIFAVIFSGILLFTQEACWGQPTDLEWKIFYEAVEIEWNMMDYSSDFQAMEEKTDRDFAALAKKYGLTESQLSDIVVKCSEVPLTPREQEIYNEITRRRDALGEDYDYDIQAIKRIYREIADKYGLSIGEISGIVARGVPK